MIGREISAKSRKNKNLNIKQKNHKEKLGMYIIVKY